MFNENQSIKEWENANKSTHLAVYNKRRSIHIDLPFQHKFRSLCKPAVRIVPHDKNQVGNPD